MKVVKVSVQLFIFSLLTTIVSSIGWDVGTGLVYDISTSILLGEIPRFQPRNTTAGDVGFQLTSRINILPIWKDPTDSETILISITIESPQLWIKSRKAPKPEGFIEHSSRLQDMSKDPILFILKNGQIKNVFASVSENPSSLNLKRGIASIFQYKTVNGVSAEEDVSGICTVTYNILKPKSFEKLKSSCKMLKKQRSHPILGIKLTDYYLTTYELTDSLLPQDVTEIEKHEMSLSIKPDATTSVTSHRVLRLLPGVFKKNPIIASTYTEVINQFTSRYVEVAIEAQYEVAPCPETGCLTIDSVLDSSRSALESSALGSAKSALAFLKLIPLIRDANIDSLTKILKSPRNHDILPQLYDLYGSASTLTAHQAAMKMLRQDAIGENTERYLWALSTSPEPNLDVLKDILKRSEETIQNDKISETLALTAAAMAKRYDSPLVTDKVRNSLELGLYSCTGEQCKMKFLRALGNLGSKSVIPVLLKHTNSTRALSIIAWKAIGSFHSTNITSEIKDIAIKTFLQLCGQKVDSSVRTLALNVILENNPSVETLRHLISYLNNQDPSYEVKKFLLQRLFQLSDNNEDFRKNFNEALNKELIKNVNYNTFSQKGLSTAFTRSFLRSGGGNGSLVTIQEINSGLLKRGIVDVVVECGSHKYTILSLGLFAGGLSSFASSSEQENDIPAENEVATAGMEISFLDVYIRPFTFFSGQGELMGHVWSGTASERTPAFQTIVNLYRHREIIALTSGFMVEIDVEGAMSVDLAGQIQLSLWSRNAQSLVEMEAGIAVQGSSKILTNFVQSRADFTLTLEPKLELATDLDFSGPISLCMKLAQPKTIVKHNIYKVERIPGSRHRLRKTRSIIFVSPARSYLLNKKNNEMCSKIFN